ncbi:permease prefix domain 1-containing protein [Deinococcus sp. Arct2-2]|uniref:permease prefix domain 1-containing protein n=1 Tax=Deinococcus sp. Arct2-2 TaxID=2568653 RepID=UPI001454DEA2|nr:permease prefix domain 1-containing protein [Deinococcus sp. Arct2-2]
MTRRLGRSRRLLSIDAYIHRATLGLPKAERLDAAAELRAHLLERTAEHEAQGFSREEAEFLAVKGMGDPQPVNRSLLGHALTHKAGWLALAVLLAGGGGWWAYREWMPPKEGIAFEAATPADIARLFATPDAPRGQYQAATVTYPHGTQAVVYANVASRDDKVGSEALFISVNDIKDLQEQNFRGRIPGSYRYQERWLMAVQRMTCKSEPRARLYVTAQTVSSQFWDSGANSMNGSASIVEDCNNPSVLLRQRGGEFPGVVPPEGEGVLLTSASGQYTLALNQWTVLRRLVIDPLADPNTVGMPMDGYNNGYSKQARGSFVAVLPLSRIPTQTDGGYSYGAGVVQLKGDTHPLPPLPPIVPEPPRAQTLP